MQKMEASPSGATKGEVGVALRHCGNSAGIAVGIVQAQDCIVVECTMRSTSVNRAIAGLFPPKKQYWAETDTDTAGPEKTRDEMQPCHTPLGWEALSWGCSSDGGGLSSILLLGSLSQSWESEPVVPAACGTAKMMPCVGWQRIT